MASAIARALGVQSWQRDQVLVKRPVQIILSFDVEEHHLIESASGIRVEPRLAEQYRSRLEPETRWLLERLAEHDIKATFFIVGQITRHSPALIRDIHRAGHEVASHS